MGAVLAVTATESESEDTAFVKEQLGKYTIADVQAVYSDAVKLLKARKFQSQRASVMLGLPDPGGGERAEAAEGAHPHGVHPAAYLAATRWVFACSVRRRRRRGGRWKCCGSGRTRGGSHHARPHRVAL